MYKRQKEQWAGFKRALEGEGWVDEERFQTALGRVAAGEEIDTLVEAWTWRRTAAEATELLQVQGVPAATVADGRILHADPQLAHLGVLAEVDHPRIGPHHVTHPAFRLSETPAAIGQGALIGEHTEHVLKDFLGMSEAEYAALEAADVLQ